MKKLLILLVLIALGIGGWFAWKHTGISEWLGGTEKRHSGPPKTAKVERRDIEETVEAVGEINPANQVAVKSEVTGRIDTIHVTTGQQVTKGDLLVSLDDTDLLTERDSAQTEINGAQLRMDKAKRDFERNRDLFADALVSREIFDNAQTELDLSRNAFVKAQKTLQAVEDKLKKIRILAAFDGTVLNVLVTRGQVVSGATGVNEGTDLIMLADLHQMVIRSHVNQVDITKLHRGTTAKITVDSIADKTLEGEITMIAPVATVKNEVKGFGVDILIRDIDPRIRPGMNAQLTFPVASVTNALAVPIGAVFIEDDASYVYLPAAGPSNGASTTNSPTASPERRKVATGLTNFRYTEIVDGLTEGETVLLERPANANTKPTERSPSWH